MRATLQRLATISLTAGMIIAGVGAGTASAAETTAVQHVTSLAANPTPRYGHVEYVRWGSRSIGVSMSPLGSGRYRVKLPIGVTLRQTRDQVALMRGNVLYGYLAPHGANPVSMTTVGPDVVQVQGNFATFDWSLGFDYFLPVVYFNRSETHRMAGNAFVVAAIAVFLPPPLNALVPLSSAIIAKKAQDADDAKKCILIHFNSVAYEYTRGYCH